MRLARPLLLALVVAVTPAAAAGPQRAAGRTSDGYAITFRVVGGAKDQPDRVTSVRVTVRSYCSRSGPRLLVASGGAGTLRKDGTFTARGGGVAVRGRRSGGRWTGSVSEFERFGADVCRAAVFFTAHPA